MDSSPLLHCEFTDGSAGTCTLLASQGSVRLWACFHHMWTSHTAGTMVFSPSQPLAQSRVTSSPRWQLAETVASSINLFSEPSLEEQREKNIRIRDQI